MKQRIDIWAYAGHILAEVDKGVLLTTKADGQVDTMTIGWGTLGNEWHKPIFTVFVRESRYTKVLLDKHPEFTINVPYGQYDPAEVKKILAVCGTKSGRDTDKIKELGLTLEAGETVDVPGICQLPLTLECKVIYRQDQDPDAINEENTARHYPRNQQFPQGDYHTAYYGQITDAYIIV